MSVPTAVDQRSGWESYCGISRYEIEGSNTVPARITLMRRFSKPQRVCSSTLDDAGPLAFAYTKRTTFVMAKSSVQLPSSLVITLPPA